MNLKDKTFIIYGASSGIGEALSVELAKNNQVGTFSRRPMTKPIANSFHFQGDVTKLQDIREGHEFFLEKFKQIDGFIYCAGISHTMDFKKFKADDVKSVMASNFFGFLNCLEIHLPEQLEKKSGVVAIVSALMVNRSLPNGAAYFSTKAAQHVFFEGLRMDLEYSGISFFEIRPGLVDTPMVRQMGIDIEKAWSAEHAARYIVGEMNKGHSDISFSKTLELLTKSLNVLPDAAYFKLAKKNMDRMFRKK